MKSSSIRTAVLAFVTGLSVSATTAFANDTTKGLCPQVAVDAKTDAAKLRSLLGQYKVPVVSPLSGDQLPALDKRALTLSDLKRLVPTDYLSSRGLDDADVQAIVDSHALSRDPSSGRILLSNNFLKDKKMMDVQERYAKKHTSLPEFQTTLLQAPSVAGATTPAVSNSQAVLNAADQFLLQRAQDEVTPWLANVMRTRFCQGDTTPTSFPNTCELLGEYQYDTSGWPSKATLQSAVRSDLELLPICSSEGWLSNSAVQIRNDLTANGTEDDSIARLLVFASFADNLANGASLTDDLIGLGRTPYVVAAAKLPAPAGPHYAALVNLSHNLYYALTDPTQTRGNGSIVWQNVLDPDNAEDSALVADIRDLASTFDGYRKSALGTSGAGWEVQAAAVGAVIEKVLPSPETDTAGNRVNHLDVLIEIAMAAQSKDYHRVVMIAFAASGCALDATSKHISNSSHLTCAFISMTDNIANATSEQELVDAMNTMADPIGGWRFKKTESGWISGVGAIVGLVGAPYEQVHGGPVSANANSIGAFAPVGYTISSSEGDGCWGSTLFGSEDCTTMLYIADFGSTADYSSQPTGPNGAWKVDSAPRSSLSSVVTAGIARYWRFGDSPWVWGIAASWSPNQRTATLADGTQQRLQNTRVMLFIGVDIVLHQWGG